MIDCLTLLIVFVFGTVICRLSVSFQEILYILPQSGEIFWP